MSNRGKYINEKIEKAIINASVIKINSLFNLVILTKWLNFRLTFSGFIIGDIYIIFIITIKNYTTNYKTD